MAHAALRRVTDLSSVRALTCPNCGGTIALRAAGSTVSLVCEHCGTTLDATSPDLSIIAQATAAMRRPEIALGTRAELRGTMWEMVGYLERDDGETGWSEYLLFNPYRGYAFLLDDERRFSLGILLDRIPDYSWGEMSLGGQGYKRFGTDYGTWVRFVVGEFYWRVAVDEHVTVSDYVRPGTMLSCEKYESERTWTRLDMLDWGEAEKAFGIPLRTDRSGTPSPHEPSPWRDRLTEAIIIAVAAIIVLVAIAIFGGGAHVVAQRQLQVVLDAATTTSVITPIDLPDNRTAVTLSARARALDNSWVDIDYSLVNRKTQESFDAYALAESYRGQDSDGAWSEGDPSPRIKLSSIPRGSYDLVVELAAHRWINPQASTYYAGIAHADQSIPVEIIVARGGMFGGNILLGLILILAWPLIVLLLHIGFEKRRMAPVTDSEDDDE